MKNIENSNKEKIYSVYKHTSPSGKVYIGITGQNPPEKRWANGKGYSHNKHFTNAINKYGWENFSHEIIADNLTEEDAQELEKELIEKYNTFDSEYGYNCTTGGEIGKQHTEEVRRKQSELAKKLWEDEEFRKRQSEFKKSLTGDKNPNYRNHKLAGENHPNYGKKLKQETVEKIRFAASNISDETRRKMSEAAQKRMTPEMIERLRQASAGRHPNEESRQKMSKSQKERWDDALRKEWSIKFSGKNNGMYGKHHSEETKKILSEKLSGENSVWYGRHHTDESKQKSHDSCTWKVPVVQLSLHGDYISEFDSYASAAKSLNKTPSQIIGCCNGDYKSAHGFIWVKKEDYDNRNMLRYENSTYKPTVKLSVNWDFIDRYDSISEAARSENVIKQNVGRSCKLKGNTVSKGFRWMYEDDYNNKINKQED